MCVGCGGACGRPEEPRFTQHAGSPDMQVIGSNWGPSMQPGHLLRQEPGVVAYESLYTGLAANGEPAPMIIPGTFGLTTRAGRGR